jgi:hypothetical protein
MLKETFSIARRNVALYLTYVLLLLAVQIADEFLKGSSSTVASTFLLCCLSLSVQKSILLGIDLKASAKVGGLPLVSFFLKSTVLFLVALIAMLPFLYFLMSGNDASSLTIWSIFAGVLIFSMIFSVVMALLGTWLPAGVRGVNSGIGDAFQRGKARFLVTYGRVLAGIMVPVLAAIVAILVAAVFTGPGLMINGRPNIGLAVITLISNSVQMIGWTYTSVVLTRRYMEADRIAPVPAAGLSATV